MQEITPGMLQAQSMLPQRYEKSMQYDITPCMLHRRWCEKSTQGVTTQNVWHARNPPKVWKIHTMHATQSMWTCKNLCEKSIPCIAIQNVLKQARNYPRNDTTYTSEIKVSQTWWMTLNRNRAFYKVANKHYSQTDTWNLIQLYPSYQRERTRHQNMDPNTSQSQDTSYK